MAEIQAKRDDTNIPVELLVNKNGGVTGLTVIARVRDKSGSAVTPSYLDFDDNTFKTAAWVQQSVTLTEVGNGYYALDGGLDISVTDFPATSNHLVIEYEITAGGESGDASDLITFAPMTIMEKMRMESVNREEVDFVTSEIVAYGDDGTTVVQRWDVTDNDDNPVVPQPGMITKRGPPKL